MSVERYERFIYEIHTLLKQSELYPAYQKSIANGKNDFKISQVFTKKNYSTDWITVLEECINSLDTIVRNPRKFIVIEEDIVDISLARSISVDSVKHLAQHTNLISSVNKQGMVIPAKILNTSKEESYEIYENRFIYTLLLKARDFLNIRLESIKGAMVEAGELGVDVNSEYLLDGKKVAYHLNSKANFPFDAVVKGKSSAVSDVERLNRIKSIFGDFLASAFAKEMSSCALVRPPIQRTNVILKDQNFKKALVLWEYIEGSERMSFKVETETETMEQPEPVQERYRTMIFLNTVLMQSIAAHRDAATTYEEEEKKKKETADEYVSKNIDDFVPDDFPFLKMELAEIRRIYYKIPGRKNLKLTEISKMNAALDRVMRQYRINKAKEESALQKRLIAEQLKEEEQAKKIALREAREEERRKKQQEILEKREKVRLERERIELEKAAEEARLAEEKAAEAERIRLEEERIELEKVAEEARLAEEKVAEEARLAEEKAAEAERIRLEEERIALEKAAEEARLAEEKVAEEARVRLEIEEHIAQEERVRLVEEEESLRRQIEEEESTKLAKIEEALREKVRKEEDGKVAEEERIIRETALVAQKAENERLSLDLDKIRTEYEAKMAKFALETYQTLRMDAEEKRRNARELAIRLLTAELVDPLTTGQEKALVKLIQDEAIDEAELKVLKRDISIALDEKYTEVVDKLKREARTFLRLETIVDIIRDFKENVPTDRKYTVAAKLLKKRAVKTAEKEKKKHR